MKVVGGVYRELCVDSNIDQIFGSGGRAAVALSTLAADVELFTYLSEKDEPNALAALEPTGISIHSYERTCPISFRYLHSLARPQVWGLAESKCSSIAVEADAALVFGMIEGSASVKAKRLVLDPQHEDAATILGATIHAQEAALVLNAHELRRHAPFEETEADAAAHIMASLGLAVLVVKAGASGARVYSGGVLQGTAPAYRTNRVFKIGSGDIFSTAFAHAWINKNLSPLEAASYASASTAHYCETRATGLFQPKHLPMRTPIPGTLEGQVYIASPFFGLGELWLVEESARALSEVGARPFSPFHEIGFGPPERVAQLDLEALKRCQSVLAIATGGDPGTLFEVGFACSLGIPVVVLAQNTRAADTTMPEGTGCIVTDDFATAVYAAAWAARR